MPEIALHIRDLTRDSCLLPLAHGCTQQIILFPYGPANNREQVGSSLQGLTWC